MSVKSKPATCSQAEASKSWETTAVTVGARRTPLDGGAVRRDRRSYREREGAGPAVRRPRPFTCDDAPDPTRRAFGCGRTGDHARPPWDAALGKPTEGSGCEHGDVHPSTLLARLTVE